MIYLRRERKLLVIVNKVFRKIFVPEMAEVSGQLRDRGHPASLG
jgi:hypothetical protein